jgi:hypothetical protein
MRRTAPKFHVNPLPNRIFAIRRFLRKTACLGNCASFFHFFVFS